MKRFLLLLIPLVALSAAVALYFWPERNQSQAPTVAAPAPAAKPAIGYPVSAEPAADPLPPLADSDDELADALAALLGQRLPAFVYPQNIIRRVVATIDNLPRDHVAPKLMPVKPVTGVPVTENIGASLVLSPKNTGRYQVYVRTAEAVPTDALVAVYTRYYPLFQEQYEKLGYPDRYFNDRAVEVIDHLLTTPEVPEQLSLVQPGVLYEFADPKLESLSAGQKILLRMGKVNRDKVKSKLQELRQALVSMAPKE